MFQASGTSCTGDDSFEMLSHSSTQPRHTECTEEGTRNVVAECLGKLCLMSPAALLPKLKASLTSQSALMRTTVVTAMKFTISDQPQPIDQLLRAEIGHFLTTLRCAFLI